MSSSEVSPISIHIRQNGAAKYKSIGDIDWQDIPGLAILTGRNGAGKSQLLSLIATKLTGAAQDIPTSHSLNITGNSYTASDVGYVIDAGASTSGTASSVANLQSANTQIVNDAFQARQSNDPNQMAKAAKLEEQIENIRQQKISEGTSFDIQRDIPDDLYLTHAGMNFSHSLSNVFFSHRLRRAESLEAGTPGIGRDGSSLGPAPWDVLNDSLKVAEFPFELIPPTSVPITSHYELKFKDLKSGSEVDPAHLSSGEKSIFQLVLWLYTANKEGVFPKLLLLDEPDAHLHPALTVQFLNVISDVLVNKYGVRVIMTTHSPSTVALAPVGSVFVMERGKAEITKITAQDEAVSMLTSGLVTVWKSSKFCLVEDEDDVRFYDTVRNILIDSGPSRDPAGVTAIPSLVFLPASHGTGSQKTGGGASVVRAWTKKLAAEPLSGTFFGITDLDSGNAAEGNVWVIGRYCIENYLLDPVNIFSLLIEEGKAPKIAGVNISAGDEHLIRQLSSTRLQKVVDGICTQIEASEGSLQSNGLREIFYTNKKKVKAPSWLFETSGKELLPVIQTAFGAANSINPTRLLKSLKRCRMVPYELAQLIKNIQSSS